MRQPLSRKLRFAVSSAAVVVLVLIAVGMSSLRLLVASAPQFRAQVEQLLSAALEIPLSLDGLRAEWVGLHPKLVLEQVRIRESGIPGGLAVPELEVSLDLMASLRDWQLRPASLAVSGLAVGAERTADGRFRLTRIGAAELSDPGESFELPQLPTRLLLRRGSLQLVDRKSGRNYRFERFDLQVDSSDGTHRLQGDVKLPGSLGDFARVSLELQGELGRPQEIDGRVYLDLRGVNLAGLGDWLPAEPAVPALTGHGSLELWGELREGALAELTGRVSLAGLRARAGADWVAVAEQLSTRFQWRPLEAGGRLVVDGLELLTTAGPWPRSGGLVDWQRDEQGRLRIGAQANYLRLQDLTRILRPLQLPPALREQLGTLDPQGELLDVRLRVDPADAEAAYRLSGRFRGLAVSPLAHAPGFQGLNGEFSFSESAGRVSLVGREGDLRLPKLFREPLPFDSIQGTVEWRRSEHGWTVEAPALLAASRDGRLQADLRVYLDGGGGDPFIDLRARVRNGDGSKTYRYLPVTLLPPQVTEWLDQSIRGGHVPLADVVIYGRADDFPFSDHSGVMYVDVRIDEGELQYQPGWPAIQGLGGRLLFDGPGMEIIAERGRIFGAQLRGGRASIEHLAEAPLKLEMDIDGSGADLLKFLREAPIGAGIRKELDLLRLEGEHALDLAVEIPFDARPLSVDGALTLNQGRFSIPEWKLAIDKINGQVRFDEQGVRAEGVRGVFRGRPVTAQAITEGRGDEARIQVRAETEATARQLAGVDKLAYVSGRTRWQGRLDLPGFQSEAAPVLDLGLESNLEGVAVQLPAPLGKSADQARRFELHTRLGAKGLEPVRIRYGDDMQAVLALSETGPLLRRGAVAFGGAAPRLPAAGIQLVGRLPELDADAWRAFASAEAGGETGPPAPVAVELRVDRLRALGQRFGDVDLGLQPQGEGWQLRLGGPDLAGRVAIPASGPIQAQFQRLRLNPIEGAAADSEADPKAVPAIELAVAELWLRERALGSVKLRIRPLPDGVALEGASLSAPSLQLSGDGRWFAGADGQRSELTLSFSSTNAGNALELAGYGGAIRGGLAEGNAELKWPGGPQDFEPGHLGGLVNVVVMNGRMLQVNPGAGRLFGLISVAEIPRRLGGDFDDVGRAGFGFDRIEARLRLKDGDAFSDLVYMQGPAARVDLQGRVGLGRRDYDQLVRVTPHVSNTLPLVGALTAGPVGAVVAFVAQKLMEKQINQLTSYEYRVTGSWAEPEVQPLGEEVPEGEETPPEIWPSESGVGS